MNSIKIGIADDHKLFRKGLISLLHSFYDLEIIWEASDGLDLMEKVKERMPDIALVDIKMPKMNGIEATYHLKQKYPDMKIIALSMFDDEGNIVDMVENGANGYLLKDSEPNDIYIAIKETHLKGSYYSDFVTKALINKVGKRPNNTAITSTLTENERLYLQLICKEYTNKEIAEQMQLSERTIDGYRDKLFVKTQVKNRIGLVLFALKNGVADL